jgi:hypothetical protein
MVFQHFLKKASEKPSDPTALSLAVLPMLVEFSPLHQHSQGHRSLPWLIIIVCELPHSTIPWHCTCHANLFDQRHWGITNSLHVSTHE